MAEEWRKMYNEEFHNLHYLPHIIRIIKSTVRLAVHAAQTENRNVLWDNDGKGRRKGATRKSKVWVSG